MPDANRHRLEYQHRVNRVLDHIRRHRAEDLTLEALAQVAAFSPFHFHRIFKAVTGENLKEHIQRIRLEWAASTLLSRPELDVLAIALDSGFGSASAFARAFKERFAMTATEWRSGGAAAWSKERMAVRKPGTAERKLSDEPGDGATHPPSCGDNESPTEEPMNVTVKTLPRHRVAYMRHVGPYGAASQIPQLWLRLQRWAAARELWTPDRLCIGVALDDPRVTDPDKCRYDACIVIPADFTPDAQVNVNELQGGRYALMPFVGSAREVAACWDQFFARWLPTSGYQPDDGFCLELYRGDAFDERTGVVRCELCTPVRPL